MAAIPQIADPTLLAVDAAIERRGNAPKPRPYLGMSSIGRSCSRELWYGFRWASPSTFDAATLRRFEDGHCSEAIMIERLRAVKDTTGVQLFTEDPNTKDGQIACSDIGGHFRGHLDGVIVGLIQAPATPHVWEHKAVNEKKQAMLHKHKTELGEKQALAAWDATYYGQHTLYMDYQRLTRGYLTCDTPGSRTTISVRTEANQEHAAMLKAKAHRIITASEPPERISERPDWYECGWCSHKAICHERAIPQVNCRTCSHATPEVDAPADGPGRWTCAKYHCDIDTETQWQGHRCPAHVFIPALLPWRATDADEAAGWIEYQTDDGRTVRNGPGGCASLDIRANPGICGDAVVNEAQRVMSAKVVG